MSDFLKFEKVSKKQYITDLKNSSVDVIENNLDNIYDDILIPTRATIGSAGYDFSLPFKLIIKPHETIILPTGIRCKMDIGWVLLIFPRSGLGFKYKLTLDNTVGVIDSDYYNSDNEGHIMIKLTNNSDKEIILEKHKGICQGIFFKYGITVNDNTLDIRNGGFGSTNK